MSKETQVTEAESNQTEAVSSAKEESAVKMRWYVVQAQSNYEKRVQAAIREKTLIQNLEHLVEEVLIPVEEVIEVRKGKKVKSERKFFPSYVLVRCQMTDDVWHLINSISHVTGFVGAAKGMKPIPISNKEAERILKQVTEGVEKPRPVINIEVGESIKVTDGAFANFQGVVEAIDEEKAKLRVSVSIFGRATPIELEFTQVEKLAEEE